MVASWQLKWSFREVFLLRSGYVLQTIHFFALPCLYFLDFLPAERRDGEPKVDAVSSEPRMIMSGLGTGVGYH